MISGIRFHYANPRPNPTLFNADWACFYSASCYGCLDEEGDERSDMVWGHPPLPVYSILNIQGKLKDCLQDHLSLWFNASGPREENDKPMRDNIIENPQANGREALWIWEVWSLGMHA